MLSQAAAPWESMNAAPLVRALIHCVVPVWKSEGAAAAQHLLDCVRILKADCDVRRLQALVCRGLGNHAEAMQLFSELDGPEDRAMLAICLWDINEPSWLCVAQEAYASGDPSAMAILKPWMLSSFDKGENLSNIEDAPSAHFRGGLRA